MNNHTPSTSVIKPAQRNCSECNKNCKRCQRLEKPQNVAHAAANRVEQRPARTLNSLDWPIITLGIY